MSEQALEVSGSSTALPSTAPVPSGGEAGSLIVDMSTALCSMVRICANSMKRYESKTDDIKALLTRAVELHSRISEWADLSADSFWPLSEAYKIPRDDPKRAPAIEQAILDAGSASMEMVKCCGEAIELLDEIQDKCSGLLISDLACGAYLCRAAIESAAMNVFINTKYLKDRETARRLDAEVDAALSKYLPLADSIADAVLHSIRSEA